MVERATRQAAAVRVSAAASGKEKMVEIGMAVLMKAKEAVQGSRSEQTHGAVAMPAVGGVQVRVV